MLKTIVWEKSADGYIGHSLLLIRYWIFKIFDILMDFELFWNMKKNLILFLLLGIGIWSCKTEVQEDLYHAPAITGDGVINAVIEIPAGRNHKIEFNPVSGAFEMDQIDGKDRIIDFLPYPGNYGFIPSTMMGEKDGGDGDALDVLVIAPPQKSGTLMAVRPIGALNLIDDGELDTKIIAIPVDSTLQLMQIDGFDDFLLKYNGAMRIIETWFLNYKGIGRTSLKGWENEHQAMLEIKKWTVPKKTKN